MRSFLWVNKMANTDIKWFSFDNTNAPQLSNTWGCMIDVLDACLINGYGTQTVSSLVIQDGVAVATFAGSHKIKQFQWVEISGADEIALNAQFKVVGLTSTTIEFSVNLPEQAATGTIECKIAPLGWSKVFEGSQKGVYQAADVETNPYFLRVDNSRDPVYSNNFAKYAKVGFFETCTGIDDISGNQAPYDSANPTRNWVGTGSGASAVGGWYKWHYARGRTVDINSPSTEAPPFTSETIAEGNRAWFLIGDDSSFYILCGIFPISISAAVPTVIPHGFAVANKRNIATACLFASESGGANQGFYIKNALVDATYKGIIMMHNIKKSLVNTAFGQLFATPSSYSGYTGAATLDSGDGDVFIDIMVKDPSNYFAGTLDIVKYVLYDSSSDVPFRLITSNGRAYLYCRTAINNATGASTFLKTALAFDLGEI